MKKLSISLSLASLALVASVGLASAQSAVGTAQSTLPVELTPAQVAAQAAASAEASNGSLGAGGVGGGSGGDRSSENGAAMGMGGFGGIGSVGGGTQTADRGPSGSSR